MKLSPPQTDVLTASTPRVLCQAGQGGGKTTVMGFMSALLIREIPDVIGMIGANFEHQLTNATLKGIFEVWEKTFNWKLDRDFTIEKQPLSHFKKHNYTFKNHAKKIYMFNGCVLFIYSMENYKGIEGVEAGWCLLDETKHTREKAIKEVLIARLRQEGICKRLRPEGVKITAANVLGYVKSKCKDAGVQCNPLMIFTSPEKEQWLTTYFKLANHREEIRRRVYSRTDYFYHADDFYTLIMFSGWHNKYSWAMLEALEQELTKDRAALQIYADPFGKSGAEYYANYNNAVHEGEYYYDDNAPIKITYDFNTAPYMTLRVWQTVYRSDYILSQCIDEYLLSAPKNSIEAVTGAFLDDYEHLIDGKLYVYGDASGKNSLPLEDVKSYIDSIRKYLKKRGIRYEVRLLKQNPRHNKYGKNKMGRRDFINRLLKGVHVHQGLPVRVRFSKQAHKGNADYEFVMEDANGAKLKKKELIDGVRCESHGHASDADDALLCYDFGDFKKDKKMIGISN